MNSVEHFINPERRDSHRLAAAFLAALLLHIIAFVAFSLMRLAESTSNPAPIGVELLPGILGGAALAAPAAPSAGPAPSARPSTQGAEPGFVIPMPRQGMEATQPTGPAFRVGGPSSPQSSSVPQATSPVQEPVFPHISSALQPAGATAEGGGSHAGATAKGALVQGGGQAPVQGSLNLGSLEQSFANARGSGGEPGGAGRGGGGGGGAATGSGGAQGDYRFQWDQPEAAAARKLLASPRPQIPEWVSKQGLSLAVLVSFTLTPDGLLRDVNVEASSGFNEVDAAVVEAVRLWRFSPNPASHDIHGLIPYAIRAR